MITFITLIRKVDRHPTLSVWNLAVFLRLDDLALSAKSSSVKTAWCGARPEYVAECATRPTHC